MRRTAPLLAALALPYAAAAQDVAPAEDVTILPEVIVSANRTPTAAASTGSSVSVITGQDIINDGRPFVLSILATQPGVSVSQAGPAGTNSGFAIRGASQQYVRVAVDGIEISDPTSTQVQASLSGLLLDGVGRIEVLKGSQSALYGGQAVAGVIDISSPRATEDGLQSTYVLEGGTYGTARAAYALTGQNDRGDFSLTAAHLQTDGFSAAERADGNTEADGYDGNRLSATGTFRATDNLSLFGSAFTQHESGDFDGFDPITYQLVDRDNTYDTTTWGARAGFDLTTGALASRVAVSWFDIDRDTDEEDIGHSNFSGDRVKVEYLGGYTVSDALLLQFGADWTRETARTTSPYGATAGDADVAGVFGQAIWQPVEALTLTAALRNDDHSEFGSYPTGRLSAAWEALPDTTVRASVGTGFRAPSLYELFSPTYGNRDLDPEKSVSADLGVEQGFAEGRGLVSATLFLLDIDDLIDFTTRFEQVPGTARSRGVELAGSYDLTDSVSLVGNYTYTHSRTATGSRRLRVPLHDVNVGVEATPVSRLTTGVEVQYVAGLPDEPFANSSAWRSDYTLVNARVAYALTDAAEVYVRAENLFDEQYQTVEGYSTAGSAVYFGVRGTF
ncbi:vitamin B12 transporter [Amaricoccus macauensis]|uniref:Vitamin B12 transporter n=1 Tax=Amaricoccus macauensis TaxID=57001 RepID=A0A840STF7_9RHOB|nr:TonB-dependent receptor [Amaricoccus macauensis]MBB5223908.1 vitamin B12 transporter [Amaricoccus macauensis]